MNHLKTGRAAVSYLGRGPCWFRLVEALQYRIRSMYRMWKIM